MASGMSSRQRMLAAIEGREVNYVPCSFMIFSALSSRCSSEEELVRRQVAMGLDTVVASHSWTARGLEHRDAPGIELRYPPEVTVRQWREKRQGEPDILHKEYVTPDGTLKTEVVETEDWPYPGHVPLCDDYLVPRARKFPVEKPEDPVAARKPGRPVNIAGPAEPAPVGTSSAHLQKKGLRKRAMGG